MRLFNHKGYRPFKIGTRIRRKYYPKSWGYVLTGYTLCPTRCTDCVTNGYQLELIDSWGAINSYCSSLFPLHLNRLAWRTK